MTGLWPEPHAVQTPWGWRAFSLRFDVRPCWGITARHAKARLLRRWCRMIHNA